MNNSNRNDLTQRDWSSLDDLVDGPEPNRSSGRERREEGEEGSERIDIGKMSTRQNGNMTGKKTILDHQKESHPLPDKDSEET